MRILSCHIDAFGKFKNVDFKFDEILSVFCEKNGFGKTTLAEFIKAMFYSLPATSKKINYKSERDLYKPFDYDGKFGGSLTFSCRKGDYTIFRQFGSTPTLDKFYLFDAKSNLISNDFSSDIGEELFGVGKETFENSTFFGQNNLISGINDDIRASLSTGVLSGDDIDNLKKAQDSIQKKVKEFRAESRTLKTSEYRSEIEKLKAKEQLLKLKVKDVDSEISHLTLAQKEIRGAKQQINENEVQKYIEKNVSLQTLIDSDRDKITEKENRKKTLLEGKKLNSEDYSFLRNNDSLKKVEIANFFSYTFLFLTIIGFCLLLWGGIAKINFLFMFSSILTVGSLVVMIICFIIVRRHSHDMKQFSDILKNCHLTTKELKKELLSFEKVSQDIKFIDDEIYSLKREIDKSELEVKSLNKRFELTFGCQLENFYQNAGEREKELTSIDYKIVELKTDRRHFMEEIESVEEKLFSVEEKLSIDTEKEQEIDKKLLLLSRTAQALENSKDAISKRFVEPVSNRFNKYYKRFVKDGDNILIDSNLGLRFGSAYSDVEYLSAGLYDLVYICKRFALVDLLFKKEKPTLILDDPFANFDDDKLKVAKKLVEELKEDYQILLFTCQKARA